MNPEKIKLWTGNYGRLKGRPVPVVSISLRQPPGWGAVPVFDRLVPLYWMLRLKPRDYLREYRKLILEKLKPETVAEKLNGYVLLCYEKPNEFCHRRIVAEWLEKGLGVAVPEWGLSEPQLTVEEMIRGVTRGGQQSLKLL